MSTALVHFQPELPLQVAPPEGFVLTTPRGITMTESTFATPVESEEATAAEKAARKTEAADNARAVYETFDTTPAKVREWALAQGLEVKGRGRIHPDVLGAFATAHA